MASQPVAFPTEAFSHRGSSVSRVLLDHSPPRDDVMSSTEHTCPKCQSKAIDRVHRKDLLERFISKMRGKRLYRCLDCDHYFKDRPLTKR
jgi:DNA-directed RNA polymerase subunit RPC12/RpoP